MKSLALFVFALAGAASVITSAPVSRAAAAAPSDGFVPLFNGRDFTGWKVPDGDNGHWKVINGVIDYDARSEASGDKNLWTQKAYRDFVLKIDWRIKETTGLYPVPTVLPDGTHKKGPDGKDIITPTANADSGIYLRGTGKAQLNIWCWPIGSGEVYGYRMDKTVSPEVRAGVTPKVNADKPVGEWNRFEITMKGDRLTVVLNGKTVLQNAQLPGVPAEGPLALQHHGGFKDGKYSPASSLVQFRNISIKELPSG
jgi:hypothetical protein